MDQTDAGPTDADFKWWENAAISGDCTSCAIRVDFGLIPACQRICPTQTLKICKAADEAQIKAFGSLKEAISHLYADVR
jgi:Fe-S-cluster-containing dehydrogenase component